MTADCPAPVGLLAQLARLGIVIWREQDRLCVRMPREAQIGTIEAEIAASEPDLLNVCHETHAPDELLYPLAVSRSADRYLICIHPVHGGVFDYRHVAAAMSPTHSVYAFQALHWLDTRSIPSVRDMAVHYARRLLERGMTGQPVVLYGASAGGWIALEMARYLSGLGHEPELVVLADTLDVSTTDSPIGRVLLDRFIWVGLLEIYAPPELLDIAPSKHSFWTLDTHQRISYIIERMRALPEGICRMRPDAGRLAEYLETYQAYFRVYGDHALQPYHGRSLYVTCSGVGWARTTKTRAALRGPARLATIPGNHIACLRPDAAPEIARLIQEASREEVSGCLPESTVRS
jgi:thioesterase domain-containing protein